MVEIPLSCPAFDRLCSEIVVAASRCSQEQLATIMDHLNYVGKLREDRGHLDPRTFQNCEAREPIIDPPGGTERSFGSWDEDAL